MDLPSGSSIRSSEYTPLLYDEVIENIQEFDDILELVGSRGLYQKMLLYGAVMPLTFILAAVSYANIFTLFVPEHFCSPGVPMNNTQLMTWKLKYIPRKSTGNGTETFSSCTMYNYTLDLNRTEIPCQHKWIFDRKDFDSTIPTENGWVCERDYYATTVFTITSVGFVVGNILFGQLTDKYGRKPILFMSLMIYIIFATVGIFVTSFYEVYLATAFISGTGSPMFYSLPALIMAELSAKDYRAWVFTINWVAWILGMAVLPGVAFIARNRFILSLSVTLPGFLLIFIIPMMPESPRWLLSQGRIVEAAKIFEKIAIRNGKLQAIEALDLETILSQVSSDTSDSDEQVTEIQSLGFWSLFGTKRMAMITCCIALSRASSSTISDQLTLNSPYMSGNQFLNFFVMAVVQLPGTALAGYLIETTGRRWMAVAFYILLGGACLAGGILAEELALARIALSVVAIFSVSVILYVIFVQTAELFPTPLRGTGSALCTTTSSLAGLLNASVVYTRKFYYGAPFLCMLIISVIGSLSASFLPETIDRKLPETIEEATEFGREDKYWSFRPTQDHNKNRTSTAIQC